MTAIEFQGWPKTPRLFRDAVVTEKIDGTNAAICIRPADDTFTGEIEKALFVDGETQYLVYAQSRNRIITPEADNYGFARWVYENASTLVTDLGPGLHFGEWWGLGIQRGYDWPHKTFSLFNVDKWGGEAFETSCLDVVPVIARGVFDTGMVAYALNQLRYDGSHAAPGFMRPEGVCVYHTASRQVFKATIENDEKPKGSKE